jgi:hypothetical protein
VRQGETDHPTATLGHEVHRLGRHMLRGHDEITFIFPVFIVYQDNELAFFNISNRVFDIIERRRHGFTAEWFTSSS